MTEPFEARDMQDVIDKLADGLHKLPADDQIDVAKVVDRWEDLADRFHIDPKLFDFPCAIIGVELLGEALVGQTMEPDVQLWCSQIAAETATVLALMAKRQKADA